MPQGIGRHQHQRTAPATSPAPLIPISFFSLYDNNNKINPIIFPETTD
jgi:hypothetical protein